MIDEKGTEFSGAGIKESLLPELYRTDMVILDETAALDALAESKIYESFDKLVGNKTAVYVSHRLASTKFCDKIALFTNEGLQEYGSHEELMARRGEYYRMFMTQGKYYQEEAK